VPRERRLLPPVRSRNRSSSLRDLIHREHLHPRGCQLDGERNAVEPPADLGHCGSGLLRELEVGCHEPRPINEEPRRIGRSDRTRIALQVGARHRKREHGVGASPFTPKPSRLVTRSLRSAADVKSRSERVAHAASTCSQLSNTTRVRLSVDAEPASLGSAFGLLPDPRAAATARGTRSGSESGANSTNHVPSGCSSSRLSASLSADASCRTSDPREGEKAGLSEKRPTFRKLPFPTHNSLAPSGDCAAALRRPPRPAASAASSISIRASPMSEAAAGDPSRDNERGAHGSAGAVSGGERPRGLHRQHRRHRVRRGQAWNARRPVRHSRSTHPKAKMSVRRSAPPLAPAPDSCTPACPAPVPSRCEAWSWRRSSLRSR